MPQAAIPAAIGAAGAIGSSLIGRGGGGQQVQQSQPMLVDRGIYALGSAERDALSQGQFALTAGELQRALSDPGGWMSGSGLGIGGGGASAGRASAGTAEASLIDMNDEAFQSMPPAQLLAALAQRAGKGAARSYESGARDVNEGFALSGRDVNSPLALYLKGQAKQQAYSGVNDVMGSFFDSFVQNALGRRGGALGTNAQLGTQTSISNAGFQTQASVANAGNATQASIANAQMRSSASAQRAALGMQRASMLWSQMNDLTRPIDQVDIVNGGSSSQYQPGPADIIGGLTDMASRLPWGNWGGGGRPGESGGQMGDDYGPYPSGGTDYFPTDFGPGPSNYVTSR